jgi:succinate-semialdehyde dehydrogenase
MAQMITLEMGKPIAQARAEIEKCAQLSEWYAAHGPAMLAPEPTLVDNGSAHRIPPAGPDPRRDAVELPGVASAARRRADPARRQHLRAQTRAERDGQRLPDESRVSKAGFPEGLFEVINVTTDGVSSAIADPRIAAVTLTGSVRAGMAIGSRPVPR